MTIEEKQQRQLHAARLQYEEIIRLVRDVRASIEHEQVVWESGPSRWALDDSPTHTEVQDEWHTMTLDKALAGRIERAAGQQFAGDAAPEAEGTDDVCPF